MIPKHYSLKSEHPTHYEIHDRRDGKTFNIAKHGLSLAMHGELSKIQKFKEGGTVLASNKYDDPDQIMSDLPSESSVERLPAPTDSIGAAYAAANPDALIPPQPSQPIEVPQEPMGAAYAQAHNAAIEPKEEADPVAAPQDVQASAPPQASPEMPSAAVGQPPRDPLVNQSLGANSAIENERKAIIAGSQAESKAGEQTATAYKDFAAQQQSMMDQIQKNIDRRRQADMTLYKSFMDKTVNPDRYWQNKSSLGKVTASLGMIFGGMGAAMAGTPNYAMQNIQTAIDRDVEAQKNDQSKAMNLWKMNREATQDDLQANLATQNQLMTSVKAKAAQYASEAAGPEAKARSAVMINQLDQQINSNHLMQSLLSTSQGGAKLPIDPSLLLNRIPEKFRDEAAKEIATAQKMKALYESVEQNVKDIKGKTLNGLFSPNDRHSAIDSFASQMDVLSDHRFNLEASKLKGDAFFPSPTDTAQTIANKDRRRYEFFRDQIQAPVFRGNTYIPLDRFESTHISPPQSPNIKTRGGVPYQQVQGGWRRVQ